jgi:hypothetical protein
MHALYVLLLTSSVVAFYVYILRPRLNQREELKEFYADCDRFWDKAWLQIKHWWLIVTGAIALILPELPDLLTQFGMFDLSFFLPEDKAKWWARVIGIAAFVLRMILGTPMPKPAPEVKP